MAGIDVAARLAGVKDAIADAVTEARGDRRVTLIAVTKGHGADAVRPALEAGHRVFGENRVQEAAAKWPSLRGGFEPVELHLVGALQTNKAAEAVALFDVISCVDRTKLIRALARAMDRSGRRPSFLVQVNTGEEPQKAGCLPDATDSLVAAARGAGLDVTGLMCIPPVDDEPSLHFALLASIAERNGLRDLSMGMSGDYLAAIALGATHVRVGTAIFGPRSAP